VALARALVGEPAILLFDEPTATLDRPNAARMAGLLEELGRERCVIVATHDPALVAVAQTRIDLARPD
jgi:ATP-binding cassette subfamily C protein CydD